MPAPKKKLKSFGKNRREVRTGPTVYDEQGNWISTQHQDAMRTIQNPLFDRYYGELQGLGALASEAATTAVPSGPTLSASEAWEREMNLFRSPLPTTLWVNDTDPLAPEIRRYFEGLDSTMVEAIPWYPIAGMGWRIKADKTEFRKRPEMKALRQYLISQTALGTISRQEEVSMIPPFLLDIQPTDACLDMCASPGSKTAQMLVALGRHKAIPFESNASPFPFDYASDGLIVANELDTKRANMLVHQIKRLRLLFPFALFTNHDARFFPDVPLREETSGAETPMRFDKILCDVVCSGDGTLRKAPHVFKIWSPKEGMNLQKTQVQIAMRACHLLKVGGRLVYSTCSLNPIENEAVVAQIVHRTRGAMRLVDARALLPNLPCSPGMSRWTVTDHKGHVVDAPSSNMHEALFPPNTPGGYSSPAVDVLDLTHCMRLFPSHCNGGGFFIAVLDKVEDFQFTRKGSQLTGNDESEAPSSALHAPEYAKRERPARQPQSTAASAGDNHLGSSGSEPPPTKRAKVIPPQFVSAPGEIQEAIRDFYQVPQFPIENLVVRTAPGDRELRLTPSSQITFVSKTAQRVLSQKSDSLLVVSAGLRTLAFETLNKGWRIASEAAILFAKLMCDSPRAVCVPVDLVEDLINNHGKLKAMPLEDIKDDALRTQLEGLPVGALLLVIDCPAAVGDVFYSVGLRARTKLQFQVDHEDIVGVQLRLGLTPKSEEADDHNEARE